MWTSWKALCIFCFPLLLSLCHTAVVTDVTCLFGCRRELPAAICIRPAAVPASVVRPPLTYSWSRCLWQTTNWLRSRRSLKRSHFLKWFREHDVAPASSSQTARVSRLGQRFEEVESQIAPLGPRTRLLLLDSDPRHPAVGQQMGYATATVTLPVLPLKCVCACNVLGCSHRLYVILCLVFLTGCIVTPLYV